MTELLLVSANARTVNEIEALSSGLGCKLKICADAQTAAEMVRIKHFDVVFAEIGVSIEQQQALADQLWRRRPSAPFVVFDLDRNSRVDGREVRLFGADLVRGENAIEELGNIIGSLNPEKVPSRQEFKILVVEDLDPTREIICSYLEGIGFPNTHGVASGKEALAALSQTPGLYRCILTDVRMPEMSGSQLIEHVRADPALRDLPIIVLTAHGTIDCLVECLRAGASGFLVKPPKRNDLTRELWRAVRIAGRGSNPRLVAPHEAAHLHDLLAEKGLT